MGDSTVKPVINLNELTDFTELSKGHFAERYTDVGEKIGASKLGYSVTVLEPGKMVCPFHNHRVNEEMFLILDGSGTLRFGDEEYPLRTHDIIACPPGGREVAHQIINTSDAELRYLCLSTRETADICEYPDSDKMLAYIMPEAGEAPFKHIFRVSDEVDYFVGEIDEAEIDDDHG